VRLLGAARSLVVALLALWLAVIFAAALAADTTLFGGSPDLVCVVVVSLAMLRGPEIGALAGFGAGLAVDALTWQPLGLAALVYCLIGYGAGRVGERVSDHAPVSPLVVVAVSSLIARAGLVLLSFLLGSELAVPVGVSLGAFPSAALDVLLAIPLYALLRRGLRGPPPTVSPLPHMSMPSTSSETDDVPAVLA
jgi:rod shape-determining protein MreD